VPSVEGGTSRPAVQNPRWGGGGVSFRRPGASQSLESSPRNLKQPARAPAPDPRLLVLDSLPMTCGPRNTWAHVSGKTHPISSVSSTSGKNTAIAPSGGGGEPAGERVPARGVRRHGAQLEHAGRRSWPLCSDIRRIRQLSCWQ